MHLTDEQRQVVESTQGRTVVIAGPGAGKTRVAIDRIAAMVEAGEPSDSFVVVTFSNRAALEIEMRADDRGLGGFAFCGTIHGLAWRLLEYAAGMRGALREGFTVWDQMDREQAIAEIISAGRLRCTTKGTIDWIERRYATRAYFDDLPFPTTTRESDMHEVLRRYEGMKARMNVEDFDGIVPRAIAAMMADPMLLLAVHAKWRHVVVDEYQDVSEVQDMLIGLFTDRATMGRTSMIVGDPHQTLYRFRYADPDLLLTRAAEADRALYLTTNFRSDPIIVEAAVRMSANDPMGPARVHPRIRPRATIPASSIPPTRVVTCESTDDELVKIVDAVSEYPSASRHQIAVLASTHARLEEVRAALAHEGINTHWIGEAKRRMRAPLVRKVVAALRYAVNPNDELAKAAIEDFPLFRFDADETPDRFFEWVEASTLLDDDDDLRWFLLRLRCWRLAMEDETPNADRSLRAMLRHVRTDQQEDTGRSTGVALSTFHAAKGLEWAVVLIPGMADEIVPGWAANKPETLVDARRAVYVAATRAEVDLRMFVPKKGPPTPWARRVANLAPSRFLREMGLIES